MSEAMARIVRYTEVEGKCWIWNLSRDGEPPRIRDNGKGRSARRIVYEAFHGVELSHGRLLKTTCGNTYCLSPSCLRLHSGENAPKAKIKVDAFREKFANMPDAKAEATRKKLELEEIRAMAGMWGGLLK